MERLADPTTDNLCINSIRFLAIDAVEKAKSGHPGTPMGAAPMAYVLWDRFLRHNPHDPSWFNRDRFVLSCGHASMLLYALLYLTGYDMTLNDLRNFRQWGSKTPGHPERGVAPGAETTTGPLGQGFGNAVGMAIAERKLAALYNRPGHNIVDHHTYAMLSDGDLMEGVSSEAASLAGTLGLGKLVCLYDSNSISIEGSTDLAFTEDVSRRFEAFGWQVIGPINGIDTAEVDAALRQARTQTARPSLIICRTTIGFGSPNKAGTAEAHGEPLGEEEVAATRKNLGWGYPPLVVPDEAVRHCRMAVDRGARWQAEWQAAYEKYRTAYPDLARQFGEDLSGDLPPGWDEGISRLFAEDTKPISTREASGRIMNVMASRVHSFVGGAGDLAPSTRTNLKGMGDFSAMDYTSRNFHFGVREHGMGCIANGLALHGGLIPFTATFLIFYDYMRPPVRLAAMMGLRVIYVFTHDSVGLGQDGPTHQPIEHLAGLRAVPGLVTLRPADATETAECWRLALQRNHGPTALILTRQNLPILDREKLTLVEGVRRGGYVLWEADAHCDVILIATGSEVHIALEAGTILQGKSIATRVVSLPSWEIFEEQPADYRESVLPRKVTRRISIEAASPLGWERYVGSEGVIIGLNRFGASAPGDIVYRELGLTPERVVREAQRIMGI